MDECHRENLESPVLQEAFLQLLSEIPFHLSYRSIRQAERAKVCNQFLLRFYAEEQDQNRLKNFQPLLQKVLLQENVRTHERESKRKDKDIRRAISYKLQRKTTGFFVCFKNSFKRIKICIPVIILHGTNNSWNC